MKVKHLSEDETFIDGIGFYFGLGLQYVREKKRAIAERKIIVLSDTPESIAETRNLRLLMRDLRILTDEDPIRKSLFKVVEEEFNEYCRVYDCKTFLPRGEDL